MAEANISQLALESTPGHGQRCGRQGWGMWGVHLDGIEVWQEERKSGMCTYVCMWHQRTTSLLRFSPPPLNRPFSLSLSLSVCAECIACVLQFKQPIVQAWLTHIRTQKERKRVSLSMWVCVCALWVCIVPRRKRPQRTWFSPALHTFHSHQHNYRSVFREQSAAGASEFSSDAVDLWWSFISSHRSWCHMAHARTQHLLSLVDSWFVRSTVNITRTTVYMHYRANQSLWYIKHKSDM